MKDSILSFYLSRLDPEEVILFTDAYDVMFINNLKSFIDQYDKYGASFVFSTEVNCWPARYLREYYEKEKINHRFLNSGGYIGTVGSILKVFKTYRDCSLLEMKLKINGKITIIKTIK